MAGKGQIAVFISTYESRKYVAMILKVQKLVATYIGCADRKVRKPSRGAVFLIGVLRGSRKSPEVKVPNKPAAKADVWHPRKMDNLIP
jgi:hypothetical protein